MVCKLEKIKLKFGPQMKGSYHYKHLIAADNAILSLVCLGIILHLSALYFFVFFILINQDKHKQSAGICPNQQERKRKIKGTCSKIECILCCMQTSVSFQWLRPSGKLQLVKKSSEITQQSLITINNKLQRTKRELKSVKVKYGRINHKC